MKITGSLSNDAPAARQIAMLGIEPRVAVSVDSFQLMPLLVAGTRRVALLQRRLADELDGLAHVRIMEPPYDAVPLQQALWWHPVHMHDAAHMWLRETTARVAEMIEAGRPAISAPPK